MNDYSVRRMEVQEVKDIYARIKKDFAEGEYAPYEILLRQLQNGTQDGFVLCRNGQDVAYAVCAGGHVNGYVLVSLLAVYREFRGKGLGTVFLNELNKIYSDKNGIIVEVEKPENAVTQEAKEICKKRIGFYQKAGFYLIPNIEYSIWDIPMHLMVLPLKTSMKIINEDIGQIIYDIYLELMGNQYIHKLKFRYLNQQ